MARATLIGFSAVIMWSLLALLTAISGNTPPFLLSAITFAIGTAVGLAMRIVVPPVAHPPIPPIVWLIGIGGLFGYHFLYFTALKNAPVIEASLINYLWPLLIVVCSALLPGEKLRWNHVAGTFLGLAGAFLIVTRGGNFSLDPQYAYGYLTAALSAITWAGYSLLSRRFPTVPTSVVTWFCAATAVLSFLCHLLMEETVLPSGTTQWLAVIALGLMPVGASFYAWDHGVKHGNIQVLGAASYAAPLLSTLVLIAAGAATASLNIVVACLLITAGAVLAAKSMLFSSGNKQNLDEKGRI